CSWRSLSYAFWSAFSWSRLAISKLRTRPQFRRMDERRSVMWSQLIRSLAALVSLALAGALLSASGAELPPPVGPSELAVEPIKGEDGIYHQAWFNNASFLDLREDFEEARAAGKRFGIIFEQRGCIYCVNMYTE